MALAPFNFHAPIMATGLLVVGGIAVLAGSSRLPPLPFGFGAALTILCVYVAAALLLGRDSGLVTRNANHYFFFLFGYYAFATAFDNGLFERSRFLRYAPVLIVGHVATFAAPFAGFEAVIDYGEMLFLEHTLMTVVMAFLLIELARAEARLRLLPVLYLGILALGSLRLSTVVVAAFAAIVMWRPLPPRVLQLVAVSLIVLPIALMLLMGEETLQALYVADHNTYIRAEFVRSAFSMLDDNLLLGIGFGTPYRDPTYDYLHWHPFLVWEEDIRSVTNHNSVFDAYFRFGLVFGTIFLLVILKYVFASYEERGAQVAVFLLAMGVSFNAFVENSNQMPVLCFLLAYLRHAWQRGGIESKGSWPQRGDRLPGVLVRR